MHPRFETMSLKLNGPIDRGVGGSEYSTSENVKTLEGRNDPSANRRQNYRKAATSPARGANSCESSTGLQLRQSGNFFRLSIFQDSFGRLTPTSISRIHADCFQYQRTALQLVDLY
jgi:hypothetical protein